MAAVIHHGGGVGTYKSFSVIQNHVIPQLIKGRIIVSTIRGLDSIRVIEAVLDIECHKDSEIIFVDIESIEGMEKIRRWWEWVPIGAYIIIDEAQLVYPKSKKITEYNYPASNSMTSEEAAQYDDRPMGFMHAFTMQRHNNWDLAIITPSIKMLVPEITQVAQVCYEHKRMGDLMPWKKHGWREIQHAPTERASSSVYGATQFTADKRIYKCYKSTKTGEHSISGSERSIFKNPRIIFAFSIIFISVIALVYLLIFQVFGSGGTLDSSRDRVDIVEVSDNADINYGSNGNNTKMAVFNSNTLAEIRPIETTSFDSPIMAIVGKLFKGYVIEIGRYPDAYQITTLDMYKNGATINIVSDCEIQMKIQEVDYVVRCPMHNRIFKQEKNNPITINPSPFNLLTENTLSGA